jgi:hypothetical protein
MVKLKRIAPGVYRYQEPPHGRVFEIRRTGRSGRATNRTRWLVFEFHSDRPPTTVANRPTLAAARAYLGGM